MVFGFLALLLSVFFTTSSSNVVAVDVGAWTNMAPPTAPNPRIHSPLTYQLNAGLTLLYGGFNASWAHLQDTWVYDYSANTWTNRAPSTSPPATGGHCLSYDWQSQQVIFFGGRISGGGATLVMYHETWAYDYNANTWTNLTTGSHPTPRAWTDMVYVVGSDRHIMFGGIGDSAATYSDTWEYNYNTNTWTNRAPGLGPSARFDHRMVYDSTNDKVILVGGASVGGVLRSDVWAYDYDSNTWTQRASFPTAIAAHGLAYDSDMKRVVLFGGALDFDETSVSDQTWTYNYTTDTWTQLTPIPHPPATVRTHMTYDSRAQRCILFNGRSAQPDPVLFDETWAFHLSDQPPPIPGFPLGAIVLGLTITLGLTIIFRRNRQSRKQD